MRIRRITLLAVATLAAPPAYSMAQDPAALPVLPPAVAREVAAIYNAAETLRAIGPYELREGEVVSGDLAVLEGPAVIGGRVEGRVVAINSDLTVLASARILGDVIVVGGAAAVQPGAQTGGAVRVYPDSLLFSEQGDRIVPVSADSTFAAFWGRFRAAQEREGFRLVLATGGTYNRVEGLPVMAGPAYLQRFGWGQAEVSALGIVRSGRGFRVDDDNGGYDVRAEMRTGGERGLAFGGTLYDVVRPVEDWQLSAAEVGLAAFLAGRDFRDYFNAHGGSVYVGGYTGADADITVAFRRERWESRSERGPFSILRSGTAWRPNPFADEGRFNIGTARLRVDTRNIAPDPWAGWYLTAEYEAGSGDVTSFAALSPGIRETTDPSVAYGRGFLDVRRYNRLSPSRQLNLRFAMGGYLYGDPLPAQRRLSMSGPGAVPGIAFRATIGDADASQCALGSPPAGTPAQCDRIALAQVEYRGSIGLADFGDVGAELARFGRLGRWGRDAQWVLFADLGRGWLVGTPIDDLRYARGDFPPLDTFRTGIGAGLDLDPLGVYLTKALSGPSRSANVIIRLQRRF